MRHSIEPKQASKYYGFQKNRLLFILKSLPNILHIYYRVYLLFSGTYYCLFCLLRIYFDSQKFTTGRSKIKVGPPILKSTFKNANILFLIGLLLLLLLDKWIVMGITRNYWNYYGIRLFCIPYITPIHPMMYQRYIKQH